MRSANLEAIAHLQRGIEASGHLPDGARKDRVELDLATRSGALPDRYPGAGLEQGDGNLHPRA